MHSQTITSLFTSDPSNDFTINLEKPVFINDETSMVYIEDIIIENNWYNVNKYNKNIKISEFTELGIEDRIFGLDDGFYKNKDELALNLETVMNSALDGDVTVVYNKITDKFSVTCTNKFYFDFESVPDASKILGYGKNPPPNNLYLNTQINPTMIILHNSWIYIKFYFDDSNINNLFTNNQTMSIMIPITSSHGNPIVYKPDTPSLIEQLHNSSNISSIRVVLYDQYLNLLQNDEGAVLINFSFA